MVLGPGNGHVLPMTTCFEGVRSEMIPHAWESVKHLIERGLDVHQGRLTVDAVRDNLLAAKQQLWVAWSSVGTNHVIEAAVVTEIANGVCLIVIIAGDRRERWVGHLARIEQWARASGCEAVEFTGRPGWEREPMLLQSDYRRIAVVMRKELTDGQLAA